MIEKSLIYSISVKFTTAERPTDKRKEELAGALIESLRRAGVTFFIDDDNEMVKFEYVKQLERGGRMQ